MIVDSTVLQTTDDIARFLYRTTGMISGYRQFSRGPANLTYLCVDLDGVRLLWAKNTAHALWRDRMATNRGLRIGFVVAARDDVLVRGKPAAPNNAMIWVADENSEYVHKGHMATLEIYVSPQIVEAPGWGVSGPVYALAPAGAVAALTRVCRGITAGARAMPPAPAAHRVAAWRGEVLERLEPVLAPWRSAPPDLAPALRHYTVFQQAELVFTRDAQDAPELDAIAQKIGVSKRTLFAAFSKSVGVGPRRFFEVKRLHDLRARLCASAPGTTSVTAAATDLGFNDLGRMARRYCDLFGEYPSDTLKRGVAKFTPF